jgi:hypothetical protein
MLQAGKTLARKREKLKQKYSKGQSLFGTVARTTTLSHLIRLLPPPPLSLYCGGLDHHAHPDLLRRRETQRRVGTAATKNSRYSRPTLRSSR